MNGAVMRRDGCRWFSLILRLGRPPVSDCTILASVPVCPKYAETEQQDRKNKGSESKRFRALLVAGSGFEPETSGL